MGRRLAGQGDDGIADTQGCEDRVDEPVERGLLDAENADDATRHRYREIEEGSGDRIGAPEHLGDLVGPPGVPDQAIDRRRDRLLTRPRVHALGERDVLGQFVATRLGHLGQPVDHLAPVVGGRVPPLRLGGARGRDRVAHVLARSLRHVGEELALGRGDFVAPSRLRAGESPVDQEFVRLSDVESIRHRGTPPSRGVRLRDRTRTRASHRRGSSDRSGCRCWPR